VLQAAAIGESGQVLVLDMGEPVKIVDLARTMIRLAGKAEADVEIVFSGLRPGEKLYEELLADAECTLATRNPRLRLARLDAGGAPRVLGLCRDELGAVGPWKSDDWVRMQLQSLLPEFRLARLG